MKPFKHTLILSFMLLPFLANAQLKYIFMDFEGTDIGQTTLFPSGDFKYGSISNLETVAPPIEAGTMIADRVLKVDWNYTESYGGFGQGVTKYIQIDPTNDYFSFYIYNPTSNTKAANLTIAIDEDDNEDRTFDIEDDDRWNYNITIERQEKWQLISIPLEEMLDVNEGGNGKFDIGYDAASAFLTFRIQMNNLTENEGNQTYYFDMFSLSENPLVTGEDKTDLPPLMEDGFCQLGAFFNTGIGNVADSIESIFSNTNRDLCIAHHFYHFALDGGTTPNIYPSQSIQDAIDNGKTPLITWEPSFGGMDILSENQPSLKDITDGKYDTYIQNFATQIGTYSEDVVIRLMHEMDGDWYPWCLAVNDYDAEQYIATFRHYVDIFKTKGVENVKWLWCPNGRPSPSNAQNWVVDFYPGDEYVDIVGTDFYNSPHTGTPPWVSFRYTGTPSYYILSKYFPNKPIWLVETSCRERNENEDPTSETKPEWIETASHEIPLLFPNLDALIWFNVDKEQDWRINSSIASKESFESNFWNNNYFSCVDGPVSTSIPLTVSNFSIYPNPSSGTITIEGENLDISKIELFDILGQKQLVLPKKLNSGQVNLDLGAFTSGVYFILVNGEVQKVVLQ